MTRLEIADLIERFVSGASGEWEWDDFISTKQVDPQIERVRLFCANLPNEFPSPDGRQYCGEEGLAQLRECAKALRE